MMETQRKLPDNVRETPDGVTEVFTGTKWAALKGETWTTEELQRDFAVIAFCAPFVEATRKSTGVRGSLQFLHSPRIYFAWVPAREEL
jgi:hypothetical protein